MWLIVVVVPPCLLSRLLGLGSLASASGVSTVLLGSHVDLSSNRLSTSGVLGVSRFQYGMYAEQSVVTLSSHLLHRSKLGILESLLKGLLASNSSSGVLLEGLVLMLALLGDQDNRIASGLEGDGGLAAHADVLGAAHHSGRKRSTNK